LLSHLDYRKRSLVLLKRTNKYNYYIGSLFSQSSSGGLPIDDLASIAYGVLIIVFFVLEPRGVVGLGRRVASLWSRFLVCSPDGKPGE